MLADDAHISIDGVSYVLAIDEEPHYRHRFESLFSPTQAIAGEIAKQQIRPEKLLWSITDWSGGEGGRVYYPQDPTRYDIGALINPMVRGQLTTRPRRYRSSVARAATTASTSDERSVGISVYQSAIIAWADCLITSTDAITWTATLDDDPAMQDTWYADAITDGIHAGFLPATAGTTAFAVPMVDAQTDPAAWEDIMDDVVLNPPIVGCTVDGAVYSFARNSSDDFAIYKKDLGLTLAGTWSQTTVYEPSIRATVDDVWGEAYWTSAASAETAHYFSFSTASGGSIMEIRQDVGRPYWTGPAGFAIKKLLYHQGILFALGNQVAAGSQFAGIWAIPLQTRSPVFIGAPRKHRNTQLTDFAIGCSGPGATIFAADRVSGKIFIYDIEHDAIHLFDDLANGGTGDGMSYGANERISFLAMHGSRLFGATETASGVATSLQVFSYDDLEPANRDGSQSIVADTESAEWDFGVPMEIKGLIGFYTTFKVTDESSDSGLLEDNHITISYSTDDAEYVDLEPIDHLTVATGARGRVFQLVSDGDETIKFSRLKVKITLDNNGQAIQPPVVFGVTAEAQLLAYAETWEVAVRVEDEDSNERPTSRQNEAAFLRDSLEALASNKNVVTFEDGYRYPQPNRFTTHTVVVEDPDDDIRSVAEGVMRVKLRAIR